MDELNKAIADAGGVGAFARLLGIGQSVVSNWRSRDSVSEDACPLVERKTVGAITCENLRPDVPWLRIADAEWPWHPEGRPVIDVVARVAA